MGSRYRKMYFESLAIGKPMPWIAPPANVVFADFGETMTNSVMAAGGTAILIGGIQVVSSGTLNFESCVAWGGIAFGTVMLAPIAGDVLSDMMGDIREGWERGYIVEPEPEQIVHDAMVEDDKIESPLEGEWWYKTASGRLCCYHTPADKHHRPLLSNAKMQRIFIAVNGGTPFSEREMTEKVSGLSGPRFRMLKQDWRVRSLYVMLPDKSGYFTQTGKLITSVIANYKPPALLK